MDFYPGERVGEIEAAALGCLCFRFLPKTQWTRNQTKLVRGRPLVTDHMAIFTFPRRRATDLSVRPANGLAIHSRAASRILAGRRAAIQTIHASPSSDARAAKSIAWLYRRVVDDLVWQANVLPKHYLRLSSPWKAGTRIALASQWHTAMASGAFIAKE
jgi:hypothetical protein